MTTKSLIQFREYARENYDLLRKQCLARVVRWAYTTGPLFTFLPMWNELIGLKTGRVVDSAKKAKIKCGFDANNRLICSIDDMYRDGDIFVEQYLLENNGNTYLACFNRSFCVIHKKMTPRLEWVQQVVFDSKSRVVQWINVHSTSSYIWEDERMVRIERDGQDGRWHEEFCYDDLSNLTEIWQVAKGQRTLRFKRPPKGVTLKSIEPIIRERLLSAIKKTVETAEIKQPVYCLALAYEGEGNDVLPPCLGIGLDSERQKWIEERGKDAKDFIWNPAEFTHYEKDHTQLNDKELDKACELLNGLLRPKENFAPAIKLLNAVAAELGKQDWKGKLKTTPDFVVYAVDFELADLKKNLKQSVPAAKLEKLKKTKLL